MEGRKCEDCTRGAQTCAGRFKLAGGCGPRWNGQPASKVSMIRKLKSGEFRIYSRHADKKTGKRKNLGTFASRAAAEKHERAIQYFKHG